MVGVRLEVGLRASCRPRSWTELVPLHTTSLTASEEGVSHRTMSVSLAVLHHDSQDEATPSEPNRPKAQVATRPNLRRQW